MKTRAREMRERERGRERGREKERGGETKKEKDLLTSYIFEVNT